MKSKNPYPELSKPEYEILRVLWDKGKLSVREVHNELHSDLNWAYTTTKTVMDRMVKKALLRRNDSHGVYIYKPLITRPQGLARFIQFFSDRIFELDAGAVISLFSKNNILTNEEIDELKQLIEENRMEKKSNGMV
jgi:predicted transcriptional regulator